MIHRLSTLLVLLVLLAACGGQPAAVAPASAPTAAAGPQAATFPITVKHINGEITLNQPAARIVACSEEALDFLIVLDIKPVGYCSDRVVGATNGQPYDLPNFFPADKVGTPTYVGSQISPALELISTLKPDLIVSGNWGQANQQMPQIAPTYLIETTEEGYWLETLRNLGKLTDRLAQAEQFIADYDATVARLAQEVAPVVKQSPNVLLVYSFAAAEGTMLLGNDWFGSQPFRQLGFTIIEPEGLTFESGVVPISPETVAQTAADIVFVLRPALADGSKPTYPLDPLVDSRTDTRVIYHVFAKTRPSTSPWTDRFVLVEIAGLLSR